MKGFDKQSTRRPTVRAVIPGRGRSAVTGRRKNLLYAFMALAMAAPAVHADPFDDAWECASTAVEGVADLAGDGAKALEFIASPGGGVCVTRLGAPMTAAPIGLVLTLANAGVMDKNCSATLYNAAAKPIAYGLGEALGALGVLKPPAQKFLAKIVAGELAGEALKLVPGIETVTGSLTCGCDFFDAGLSIDTIKRVLNTADRVGNACGGPVWTATKKVAGAVVEVAGDAVAAGVLAASNVGDWVAGQDKNISNTAYFNQYWAPNVENFATMEFKSPGAWHGQEKWRELWEPCVSYFDTHTLSGKNSRNVCDDMRSGNSHPNHFAGNGFSQRMFRRVFEFDVTGAVDAARKQAYIDNADMQITVQGTKDPLATDPNRDYHDANFPAERPKFIRAAVDAVFGIPKKEKKHDGLVVSNSAPPTTWPAGTVGARAFDFYDQVKGHQGNHRADAAKAVQLAMQDLDVTARVRAGAEERTLAFYKPSGINLGDSESDQDKVNAMVERCPTETCRDSVGLGYRKCSITAEEYRAANAAAIDNLSFTGQRERDEYKSRVDACLAQAKQTLRDALYHVAGKPPMLGNALPPVTTGVDRFKPGTTSGGRRGTVPASRDDGDADARVQQVPLGRRLRIREIPVPVQSDQTSEDSNDASERRHDDLPADAVIPGLSEGDITPEDDLPGCTPSRSRGQWICEDSEAHDRCLVAVERGAARGCALQLP